MPPGEESRQPSGTAQDTTFPTTITTQELLALAQQNGNNLPATGASVYLTCLPRNGFPQMNHAGLGAHPRKLRLRDVSLPA
jgi:hypothetical protein